MSRLPRPWEAAARLLGLESQEGFHLVMMGALVAMLYCTYTIAKVARDALFLSEFGALALPYAYVGVAIASAGLVGLELAAAKRFPRVVGPRFSQYLAIACSLAAAVAYPYAPHRTTAFFYLWTGSQAMMLLPHFWVLALDIWDSRQARRVFPVLAGCGLLGGLAGGAFAGWTSALVQRVGLLWTLPFFLLAASELTRHLESHRHHRPVPHEAPIAAWKIIRRSPYIRILVGTLALSVIVGTLVDFQFKVLIQQRYHDPHQLSQFLGRFYVGLNALSLLFQFGAAGWLLQRFGLGVSTGLQPAAVLALASWAAIAPGMGVVVAMRWIQGVLSQTLGKSSSEIYYTAIRPGLRRRIKPPIDTLVERWSDAAVGVLLVVALHVLNVPVAAIAIFTAVLTAAWIIMSFALDRHYGRAFQQILSSHWIEPEEESDALRVPAARRVLLAALQTGDESRIVLALRLSGRVKDARIVQAVRAALQAASPEVRAAAVDAMTSLGLQDPTNIIAGFVTDAHEPLRLAAVRHLLARDEHATDLARKWLAGDDHVLQGYVVERLFARPSAARSALTPEWIDAHIASSRVEDQRLAARALGASDGPVRLQPFRSLLAASDLEVRRTALRSATRRPVRELLMDMLPLLGVPGLQEDARLAIAALGDAAIAALEPLAGGSQSDTLRSLATNTLAQIGTPRAVSSLTRGVRSSERLGRHLGLRALARVRVRTGRPVLPRALAHRLFMRELGDYRTCMEPVRGLALHTAPEIRLLADSFRESAEQALERAVQALACWYEPEPLVGVLARIISSDRAVSSPALEYLEHLLPRGSFAPVRRLFENTSLEGASPTDAVSRALGTAWASGDEWLRACAVRGSRFAPAFDTACFASAGAGELHVQQELAARASLAAAAC